MHALTPACLLDHLLAPTLAPLIPHAACLPCIQDLEALDWMLGTARTLHYLHTQLPFGAVVHRVGGVASRGRPARVPQRAGGWVQGEGARGGLHRLHTQLPFGAVVHRVGAAGGGGGAAPREQGREKGRGGRCITCIPSCPLGP